MYSTKSIVAFLVATGLACFGTLQESKATGAETEAAVEKPAYSKWFRFKEHVTETWRIDGDSNDPNKVVIRLKGTETPDEIKLEPRWRVVVLYPRPSSAYDVAITKILDMFADRDIQAEITAINFQRKDENGRRAIDFAERENSDLIFAMGSQSTAWLWKNYRGGKIPVGNHLETRVRKGAQMAAARHQ